jgi:hypothetical protein
MACSGTALLFLEVIKSRVLRASLKTLINENVLLPIQCPSLSYKDIFVVGLFSLDIARCLDRKRYHVSKVDCILVSM